LLTKVHIVKNMGFSVLMCMDVRVGPPNALNRVLPGERRIRKTDTESGVSNRQTLKS